jgi:hypothetical protein
VPHHHLCVLLSPNSWSRSPTIYRADGTEICGSYIRNEPPKQSVSLDRVMVSLTTELSVTARLKSFMKARDEATFFLCSSTISTVHPSVPLLSCLTDATLLSTDTLRTPARTRIPTMQTATRPFLRPLPALRAHPVKA